MALISLETGLTLTLHASDKFGKPHKLPPRWRPLPPATRDSASTISGGEMDLDNYVV